MKKLVSFLICLVIVISSNLFVFASSHTLTDDLITYTTESGTVDKFKITSGISKKTEVTFDDTRTITGTAESGTKVTITVSEYDAAANEYNCKKRYVQTVGQSGVFTQDVELLIGDNYIKVAAKKDDSKKSAEFEICRIKYEVKKALEKSIALPGQKRT